MDVFRIYRRKYGPLDASGAALEGGRWNPPGLRILYAAAAWEGALLEQLAYANIRRLAHERAAARITIPDDLDVVELTERDHPGWQAEPTSRRLGEEWVASGASLALLVPSFVARPWGRNLLINPQHPAFGRVTVAEVIDVVWDPRLA